MAPKGKQPSAGSLAALAEDRERNDVDITATELRLQELLHKKAALIQARTKKQHEELVRAVCDPSQPLGFHLARPLAAMIVHRALLHWQALGDMCDGTTEAFLQQLSAALSHAVSHDHAWPRSSAGGSALPVPLSPAASGGLGGSVPQRIEDLPSDALLARAAYWLTTTSTLLALIHSVVPNHAGYVAAAARTRSRRLTAEDLAGDSSVSGTPAKNGVRASRARFSLTSITKLTLWRSKPSSTDAGKTSEGATGEPAEEPPAAASAFSETAQRQFSDAGSEAAAAGTAGISGTGLDGYGTPSPAQAFRQCLDLQVQHVYCLVRDTMKRQLAPTLTSCVLIPDPLSPRRTSGSKSQKNSGGGRKGDKKGGQKGGSGQQLAFSKEAYEARVTPADPGARFTLEDESEGGSGAGAANGGAVPGRGSASSLQLAVSDAGPLLPWHDLVRSLQACQSTLRAQHVPALLQKYVYKQVLAFINCQLFNQLLLRPEACRAGNARWAAAGLKLLDQWIVDGDDDDLQPLLRPLYTELRHVRQALTFLATPGKAQLDADTIVQSLCPDLTAQQIYRLCTTCWDDAGEVSTHPTSLAPTPSGRSLAGTPTPAPTPPPGDSAASPAPSSPPAPAAEPEAVAVCAGPDVVSGEVLEALQTHAGNHHAMTNGGLVVTFLLDVDTLPLIAPEGHTSPDILACIDDRDLYGPLVVPPQLSGPDIPPDEFAFVEASVPLPPALLVDQPPTAAP